MNCHFKQRLGTDIKVEAEVVKLNDHFGWDNDAVIKAQEDDSTLGIVNAASVRDKALNYKRQLTNNYLSYWESWMHSDGPFQVPSILDTSFVEDD